MFRKVSFKWVVLASLLILVLVGCGGSEAVKVADIPAFTDAVALKAGEDPIADTLIKNMEQNNALTTSMGVGGTIEQMAYKLPAGTTWDAVNSFYKEKLEADGWSSGMGGPGGDIANQALEAANQGNDLFQTAMWNRGKQILTIVRQADPTDESKLYLIFSLNTN